MKIKTCFVLGHILRFLLAISRCLTNLIFTSWGIFTSHLFISVSHERLLIISIYFLYFHAKFYLRKKIFLHLKFEKFLKNFHNFITSSMIFITLLLHLLHIQMICYAIFLHFLKGKVQNNCPKDKFLFIFSSFLAKTLLKKYENIKKSQLSISKGKIDISVLIYQFISILNSLFIFRMRKI